MNMFLHELKSYRKSTIIWTISLIVMAIFYLSIFPSIHNDGETFKKLFLSYPESVRKAMGITIDSVTSFLGFYSFIFIYILLCGAIQAMNLGTSIVSKEIREKTADFLLTKPVSRFNIITSKILAVLTSLIITNALYLIAVNIFASIISKGIDSYNSKTLFLISLTMIFVQLMFMTIGILISVIAKKIKSVLAISLGTVFGFFILSMLGSIIGDKAIRYLTPFKYFDSNYIIKNTSYEAPYVITGIIFMIIAIVVSYYIYIKKDIHAV